MCILNTSPTVKDYNIFFTTNCHVPVNALPVPVETEKLPSITTSLTHDDGVSMSDDKEDKEKYGDEDTHSTYTELGM